MKILFLVSNLNTGGAERTIVWLSAYLAGQGDDVTIATFSEECGFTIDPKVHYLIAGIPAGAEGRAQKVSRALARRRFIKRTIADIRPDIVFCMMMDFGRYAISKRVRRGAKLVVSERCNPDFYDRKTNRVISRVMKASDGIIFQTKRIRKRYPKVAAKSTVIPNAIGNADANTVAWNPKSTKRIVAVGRLTEQKAYPILLEAFGIFLKKHPGYTLEIYGEGSDRDALMKHQTDLGLGDSVKWMGNRTDVLSAISTSDFFVMSSRWEGMPNALMEAMAIGMPCISTDCNYGPAELIRHEKNGLLVPVDDKKALADAMSRMADEPAFAASCAKNAAFILKKHSVARIGEQYRCFLKKMML